MCDARGAGHKCGNREGNTAPTQGYLAWALCEAGLRYCKQCKQHAFRTFLGRFASSTFLPRFFCRLCILRPLDCS